MLEISNSPVFSLLQQLNLVDIHSVESYFPRCRDREDVPVYRCRRSGIIFLASHCHLASGYYRSGDVATYYQKESRAAALKSLAMDDERRAAHFKQLAMGAKWLDVGTGLGGFLALAQPFCAEIVGVEPQAGLRQSARDAGLKVLESIASAPTEYFDCVSLFHVFEHLIEPLAVLREAFRCLRPGGSLIVEVPHARDFLLSTLDLEAFKRHTLWSEHLILHTRESLGTFLSETGFYVKAINGFQRYPLANHLHWLRHGQPGGHNQWPFLRSDILDQAYSAKLAEIDANDTIIALAAKL